MKFSELEVGDIFRGVYHDEEYYIGVKTGPIVQYTDESWSNVVCLLDHENEMTGFQWDFELKKKEDDEVELLGKVKDNFIEDYIERMKERYA